MVGLLSRGLVALAFELDRLEQSGVVTLTSFDEGYPERLHGKARIEEAGDPPCRRRPRTPRPAGGRRRGEPQREQGEARRLPLRR